jgi:hypothetical protein
VLERQRDRGKVRQKLEDRELETNGQAGRELETNRQIFSYKETRTHSVREKYIKGEMEIKRHRVRKT